MSTAARAGALTRVRSLIAVGLLATSLVLAVPRPALAAPAPTPPPTVAEMTRRVFDDTNAVRAEQGLRGLVRDTRLDQVAADWARQQWENGAMSHNPDYSTQIPSGWQRAGENVGKGYTYTQIVPAWRASAGHYANLVGDYTSVGIGYYEQDGSRYWSQVFAKYPGTVQPPPGSTDPTASPAAEPAAPAGTAIALSSASFETGTGTWSAPSGVVDGPNSYARGGTRSLLVPGASGRTVTQSVSVGVVPGSTHTLTVWLRADAAASGVVRLRAVGGTTETAAVNFGASEAGWLKVSIALTATAPHSGFVIEIVTSTAGRTYRIDSASLVRTAEPATAPAPPATPENPAVISVGTIRIGRS